MTPASASPDSIRPDRSPPRACAEWFGLQFRFYVTVDTFRGIVDVRQTHSSLSDLAMEPAYTEVHYVMSIEKADAILRNGTKELACPLLHAAERSEAAAEASQSR